MKKPFITAEEQKTGWRFFTSPNSKHSNTPNCHLQKESIKKTIRQAHKKPLFCTYSGKDRPESDDKITKRRDRQCK